jgi:hypothetical protein
MREPEMQEGRVCYPLDEREQVVVIPDSADAAQLSAFDAPRSCPGYCNEFTIEGRCRHTTEVRNG